MIKTRAFARAGLLGNPSDGFNGKTISLAIRDFFAETVFRQSDHLEIIPGRRDHLVFDSIDSLCRDVETFGYYGGVRLVKAAIRHFTSYCRGRFELASRNFTISYSSNIPECVGLAGSSAIVVATLRGLLQFFPNVVIDRNLLPSIALAVERDELGIPAGLQDRVIQVFEGVVEMDFQQSASTTVDGYERGNYREIDASLIGNIYIAYKRDGGEPTEVVHNDLRERFGSGDPATHQAMRELVSIVDQGRDAIETNNQTALGELIDRNFDIRQSICNLRSDHVEMVTVARRAGASAKYCGSGGAIIGTYSSQSVFDELTRRLQQIDCEVFIPTISTGE